MTRHRIAGAVAVTLGVALGSRLALAEGGPAPTAIPDAAPSAPTATPSAAPTAAVTTSTGAPPAARNDGGAPAPESAADLGKVPAYVVGGLAVVTLGVGAVFAGLSVSDHRQFVQHPTTAAANRGDSRELVADMCFGGAATLGVAALVMFLTHEPVAPAAAPAPVSAAPRVTWSPVMGQHTAGAGASVSF